MGPKQLLANTAVYLDLWEICENTHFQAPGSNTRTDSTSHGWARTLPRGPYSFWLGNLGLNLSNAFGHIF